MPVYIFFASSCLGGINFPILANLGLPFYDRLSVPLIFPMDSTIIVGASTANTALGSQTWQPTFPRFCRYGCGLPH